MLARGTSCNLGIGLKAYPLLDCLHAPAQLPRLQSQEVCFACVFSYTSSEPAAFLLLSGKDQSCLYTISVVSVCSNRRMSATYTLLQLKDKNAFRMFKSEDCFFMIADYNCMYLMMQLLLPDQVTPN